MTANQLTVQAWSESVGISRQAGYAAIARCNIPVQDGKVDADVATVLYRKRTRARANERRSGDGASLADAAAQVGSTRSSSDGGRTDGGGDDYWASRARREQAEAELAELKLAEQRGELVRAADVRTAYAKLAAGLRESLLQVPARLAAVLAAETEQAKCHDTLQSELHNVLAQLTEPA